MTQARVILAGQGGAVDLNDGLYVQIGYNAFEAVLEPAVVAKGATIQTFAGTGRVRSRPTNFEDTSFKIDPVYLINGNGYNELRARAHDLYERIQGRPAQLQIGSLFADVELDIPKYWAGPESTKTLGVSISGVFSPSTWKAKAGFMLGTAVGMYVKDDRRDRADYKFTDVTTNGKIFQLTNPGSVPCKAALQISVVTGSDIVAYFRNLDPRSPNRFPVTVLASDDQVFVFELAGITLMPGKNTIRVEQADGTLHGTANWKIAMDPTRTVFEYLGDDADRFNDYPLILSGFRTSDAFAVTSATGSVLTKSTDRKVRVGSLYGNYGDTLNPSGGNNTNLTATSISGTTTYGAYTLQVIRTTGTPMTWEFSWAGGTSQTFTNTAWDDVTWPLTLVGGSGAGTIVVTKTNSTAPAPNGTYQDTITVLKGLSDGIVLEGEYKNLLDNPEDFSGAEWVGTATITVNTNTAPDGTSTADKVEDTSAAAVQAITGSFAITNSQWYTISVFVKKTSGALSIYPQFTLHYTGGSPNVDGAISLNTNTGAIIGTGSSTNKVFDCGDYWRVCLSMLNNAVGNTNCDFVIEPAYTNTLGGSSSVALTGFQIMWGARATNTPFPDSYHATTRYADYLCLNKPHNYLKYSRRLIDNDTTDKGRWVKTANMTVTSSSDAASDGTNATTRLNITASPAKIYQSVTPDVRLSDHAWTFAIACRQGTVTGSNSFNIAVEDQSGSAIATKNILGSDLSATETRTFFVVAAPSSAVEGLRTSIYESTGTGTVIIEDTWLVRGRFPGESYYTEKNNIPYPYIGWDKPDWATRNFVIEFDALLPPISTGRDAGVFGSDSAATAASVRLYRPSAATAAQNFLDLAVRFDNGTSYGATNINVGNVWDDKYHTFKIQLIDENNSAGTRTLKLKLDVDSVNKLDTTLSSVPATAESDAFNERFWISNGTVFAVIKNLKITTPTITAGSTPG